MSNSPTTYEHESANILDVVEKSTTLAGESLDDVINAHESSVRSPSKLPTKDKSKTEVVLSSKVSIKEN